MGHWLVIIAIRQRLPRHTVIIINNKKVAVSAGHHTASAVGQVAQHKAATYVVTERHDSAAHWRPATGYCQGFTHRCDATYAIDTGPLPSHNTIRRHYDNRGWWITITYEGQRHNIIHIARLITIGWQCCWHTATGISWLAGTQLPIRMYSRFLLTIIIVSVIRGNKVVIASRHIQCTVRLLRFILLLVKAI